MAEEFVVEQHVKPGIYANVLSAADITFGIYEKDLQLINHIILLGKQIICVVACL